MIKQPQLLICLCVLATVSLMAQHEDKNWYFGSGTDGIVFDENNIPIKVSNKAPGVGFEGMIVVTEPATGELKFYSNGIKVIDKNHNTMTNGTGLTGDYSGAQCVQCCPIPGTCYKYYLFTNSAYDLTSGVISYSIIDFSNPLYPFGIVTNKNTLLWPGPSDQGMCLVNKPNSNDYWLIANSYATAKYNVFPITGSGIGSPASFTFAITGSSYQMNYSLAAGKIVVTGYGNKRVTVIDFNANNGILSNEVQLGTTFGSGTGAARFSPDGSKLYAVAPSPYLRLFQYDFNTLTWIDMQTCCFGHDLRVGPDGKMYHIHTYYSNQPMAVIDYPNNSAVGNACNYHVKTFTPAFNGEVRRFPEFVTVAAPPKANKDIVTVYDLLPISINVLVNDSDPQGDPIILDAIVKTPSHGIAIISGNSTISYTADTLACNLLDTLIYRIKDNTCATDTALVIFIIKNYVYVQFTLCFDSITTINSKPIVLKGGIPLNGIYSGPGVNSTTGSFDPAVAGIGAKTITYNYTNSFFCSANKTKTIFVQAPPAFMCGDNLTDIRDNKIYATKQIGGQCWMASNLNYGTMISSSSIQRDNCINEKYCLDNLSVNCGNLTFYQWDELMRYDDKPARQGLCPPEWHVPTEAEWNTLFAVFTNNGYAGTHLKYTGFSGFNALLTGTNFMNVNWYFDGFTTFFWSSTTHSAYKAWAHGMNDYNPSVSFYPSARVNAFSTRCVKD